MENSKKENYLQMLDRVANMDVSDKIGNLKIDENGNQIREVNGKTIVQIEEKTFEDKMLNEAINRWRCR